MGMTQEPAGAAAGGKQHPVCAGNPWGLQNPGEPSLREFPRDRAGSLRGGQGAAARAEPRPGPLTCPRCAPAHLQQQHGRAQAVLGALLAPRGEQRSHRREGEREGALPGEAGAQQGEGG